MKSFSSEYKSSLGEDVQWKKIIQKCDSDRDGKISWEEFFTAASDRASAVNKKNLREAFDIIDLDKNGEIDAQEIKRCFTSSKIELQKQGVKIEDKFFESIVKSIDADNDGKVIYEEFERHMLKMVEPKTVLALR